MKFKTIAFSKDKVTLLDQNALPLKVRYIDCKTEEGIFRAIKKMNVRGAPLIGVTASFGAALCALRFKGKDKSAFLKKVNNGIDFLSQARPTAVNLFWALERMRNALRAAEKNSISFMKKILVIEAKKILKEDKTACLNIAKNGADLIEDGDAILVHCNAGALAAAGMGTALAPIYYAKKQGKRLTVYVDETRPKLQGARLTSWELQKEGLDPVLICDTTAAVLMKQGKVKKVFVGADRIALNGDTANKIGTYSVSVLASKHGIPFYVAAPVSTIDFNINNGNQIPIEERSEEEVVNFGGRRTAPKGIKVYNPVFDVTPAQFITAIITDKAVIKAPFRDKLMFCKISC